MGLDEAQIERYARHIVLEEIGGVGQSKLLDAKVLVVGAGGLGSPLLMYLAAAGVGTIGVADDDAVSLSNLQRQIVHTTDRVGLAKTDSARRTVADLNPDVRLIAHPLRLVAANAQALVEDYDIVADGSDNFATRFLVNDACFLARTPLVAAAILRFDAQISTYKAYLGGDHPCYRCIFSAPPPDGLIPSCAEGGVLGALAGAIGSFQAIEVVKEVLGIGDSLSGRLVIFDALGTTFRTVAVKADPNCPLCGRRPAIRDLSAHA